MHIFPLKFYCTECIFNVLKCMVKGKENEILLCLFNQRKHNTIRKIRNILLYNAAALKNIINLLSSVFTSFKLTLF